MRGRERLRAEQEAFTYTVDQTAFTSTTVEQGALTCTVEQGAFMSTVEQGVFTLQSKGRSRVEHGWGRGGRELFVSYSLGQPSLVSCAINSRYRKKKKKVRREPGRDGKILCDHRQDGNDEVHRL